jgi:flagellar motor protein MotB
VKNGIKGRRIAVEVVGNNEPIKNYVQDNNQGARNRRVSIIVLEELVKDYQGSPKKTGDITNNG